MKNRPSNVDRSAAAGKVARLAGLAAGAGLERLEERVFLSVSMVPADLPDGSALIRWGAVEDLPVKAGSYVITFDDYLGQGEALRLAQETARRLGVQATQFESLGRGGWATFRTSDFVSAEAARRVSRELGGIATIQPDALMRLDRTPNDPELDNQWAHSNTGQVIPPTPFGVPGTNGADVDSFRAWDLTIGSRDVVIAVIDSGIDILHPDLAANLWINPGEIAGNGVDDDANGFVDDVNGFDFGESRGRLSDLIGHGTEVAGVIGAVGNNGTGVTGVAWNVSIMGLKIADQFGGLSTAAIIAAHDYATAMRQRGVNVVASNNSYGAYRPDFYEEFETGIDGERAAIQRWLNAGGVFVASAGNNSADNDQVFRNFPASYNLPGIISVAATDNNDGLADFSAYGAQSVDLGAPGVSVRTTAVGGGYAFVDGTSFSAPMVTGAVALIKSLKPSASAPEIRQVLIDSADPLPALQGKTVSGGRLNVFRALQFINREGPSVRAINPGPVTGQLDGQNNPISTVTIDFTKDIDPAGLSAAAATLVGAGIDGIHGTGDDRVIPVTNVSLVSGNVRRALVSLDLSSFALSRLPIDNYRLTLVNTAFRDPQGNRLNGTTTTGADELYDFRVVLPSGDNEPNDTSAQATPVTFDVSGRATFAGVTIGNGIHGNLDVDLYRITMVRGGQITAEVTAQRRAIPSSFDSYLRLFNAQGEEITSNDQFFGNDSLIDFFVSTGGIYYLGVSGFGNERYSPLVGGSGSSQSTGTYDLSINVSLATDDVVNFPAPTNQLPRRIPVAENQTQGTTTSSITITDSRSIKDVNVRLNLSHTFVGDLTVSLIAPNNTELVLINRRGGATQDFASIVLDDESSVAISAYPSTGVSNYRPDTALGAFDALSAAGIWTLRIVDSQPLNAGQLLSWSLDFTFENNIFGPLEFNDTIATAKLLNEINGVGTSQREAFLGDGAFGLFDRDAFRFTASAGSTLNASVTSLGQLDSAVRLFDQAGNSLLLSSPAGSNNSQLQNYVFSTGGTFFIVVSESSNVAYNPLLTGDASERSATTTGAYRLNVTLSPGVGDPTLTLSGSSVSVGLGTDGTFAGLDAVGARVGVRFAGTEFIIGGVDPVTNQSLTAQNYVGAIAGNSAFLNSGPGGTNSLPFSLVNRGDATNRVATATGNLGSLRIDRTLAFANADGFIAIDILLTNTGTSSLANVGWMEGFNPNPGVGAGDGGTATSNDIDGRLVRATYVSNRFQSGLTIALAAPAADTRASVNVLTSGAAVRDANQIFALPQNDPNGATSDAQMVMAFNVGTLGVGESTRLRYFVLMGDSPTAVDTLYGQINNNSGAGHLTANISTNTQGRIVVDSGSPAVETLQTGTGPAVTAPRLPYSLYYPEGFSGPNITTSIRVANTSDQPARVVVIARFETGIRDQLLFDGNLAARGHTTLELLNPATFAAGTSLITRDQAPYALEVRSEQPVSAIFRHNDVTWTAGSAAAVGEAFTSQASTAWSFGDVGKGGGQTDFVLFQNTSPDTTVVNVTFIPLAGGTAITTPYVLEGFRRGGIALKDSFRDTLGQVRTLADGRYGVTIQATRPIVASVTQYNSASRSSEGALANEGAGSTSGVVPEGQFGLNASNETVSVLNVGSLSSDVTLTFIYANGSADRRLLTVPGNSVRQLPLASLSNFTRGQAYSLSYEATQPVSVSVQSGAFNDQLTTSTSARAYSYWGFGDGFRRAGATATGTEYLRVFNPSTSDTVIEITLSFAGSNAGSETFRRTVGSRRVAEFNIDDFITGNRRTVDSIYGITLKSANPVVAYYGRADTGTNSAFGTLGTPLGLFSGVV